MRFPERPKIKVPLHFGIPPAYQSHVTFRLAKFLSSQLSALVCGFFVFSSLSQAVPSSWQYSQQLGVRCIPAAGLSVIA
jgi:hypothetical protein